MASWLPTWFPKPTKIQTKIDVHARVFLGKLLTLDFHRNSVRQWIKQKSAERIFAWKLIWFIHFRHVGALLKIRHDLHPKNFHFASQNPPKSFQEWMDLQRLQLFDRFQHRFFNDLGSNWVPSWVQVGDLGASWSHLGTIYRSRTGFVTDYGQN